MTIANPLSAKFDTLRPSLLPGLVDAVAHNRRHGRRDVRLFEIGTRFTPVAARRAASAVAWTGGDAAEHWSGGAREVDFFDVKGVVEQVCARRSASPCASNRRREPFLVPGQAAAIVVADGPARGARVGLAGQMSPAIADARGLPRQDRVLVAELNLDRAAARARAAASDATRPLPRHPFVVRDLSIVVADTLPAEIIRGTIQAAGAIWPAPLGAVELLRSLSGQGRAGRRGQPVGAADVPGADRTLTDAEVQQSVEQILAALVREHAAVQR